MRIVRILLAALILTACGKSPSNTLVIGTISGPETELVETARDVAQQRYGLTVKIVEFNDYNLPNEALQDGSLDANIYQHLPYLNTAIKARGYTLEPAARTFLYPMGVYSSRYKSLRRLPKGALIALPNDPSNEARALLLLKRAGLISLKSGQASSAADIARNPKNLRFTELDAAQLPRVLPDVDAAVINTTFALPAGLNPTKDAIFMEGKHSPYANLIVVRRDNAKKEETALFIKAFQSPEVLARAKKLFKGAAIPAW